MRSNDAALCPRMTPEGEFYFPIEHRRNVVATSPRDALPADRDARIELARAALSTAPLVIVEQPTART